MESYIPGFPFPAPSCVNSLSMDAQVTDGQVTGGQISLYPPTLLLLYPHLLQQTSQLFRYSSKWSLAPSSTGIRHSFPSNFPEK